MIHIFINAIQSVKTLDCSPFKSVDKQDKKSYVKRKLNQMHSAAKKKFAQAFEQHANFVESSEEEYSCLGCKD